MNNLEYLQSLQFAITKYNIAANRAEKEPENTALAAEEEAAYQAMIAVIKNHKETP